MQFPSSYGAGIALPLQSVKTNAVLSITVGVINFPNISKAV